MLSYEIMGLLALGILWVNTLLLAGAALTPLGELIGRLRRWRRDGLIRATVVAGDEDGLFARYEVEQTGHKAADDDDRPAIAFHDRAYRSFIFGGRVAVEGEELVVDELDGEVWVSQAEKAEAGACPHLEAFDTAYASARKAKGWRRSVQRDVTEGAEVLLHLRREGDRLVAPEDGSAMVATFDPRGWCRFKAALVVGFQLLVIALASGITYLALHPPLFGTVSTIGGVAGLIYFITIQAVGVSVREMALLPPVAASRGSWLRPRGGQDLSGAPGRPLPNGT